MVRLSLILPCYNVENYIGACLDSLFRQDIPISEYEVICVNDCSTDNTKQVILDYIQKYPTIHLINHEINQTVGGARNTGLAAAQGSYVWFVDPDDMIVDNTLRELLKRAESPQWPLMSITLSEMPRSSSLSTEKQTSKHCP